VPEERLNCRFVPNILKEPNLYYFDVPKMGCFIAIPLNYNSCLSEESFIAGVDNLIEVRRLQSEQEADKLKSEA
jgi:hypothetical protein